MKKVSLLFLLLFIYTFTFSQTWQFDLKSTNTPTNEIAMQSVGDDFIFYANHDFFQLTNQGDVVRTLPNVFITNTNHTINTSNYASKVVSVNDDFVLAGTPFRLTKVNSSGNTMWSQSFSAGPVSSHSRFRRMPAMIQDGDDFVIANGKKIYTVGANGNVLSEKDLSTFYTISTIEKQNDDYILLGYKMGIQSFLITVDDNGESEQPLDYNALDFITHNGSMYIIGSKNGQALVEKFDANGNIEWRKNYGNGTAFDIIEVNGDLVMISGDEATATILKIDTDGNIVWEESYEDATHPNYRMCLMNTANGYLFASPKTIILTDKNGQVDREREFLYPTSEKGIEINNISTSIRPRFAMFSKYQSELEAKLQNGANTINGSNLWLSGFTNNYRASGSDATFNFFSDYQPGFIGSSPIHMEKVWKIRKDDIEKLRADFEDDGQIDMHIPSDIFSYPAFRNTRARGKSNYPLNITVNYLEFEDKNQDGVYNVFDGDLPIIKGDIMLVWFKNDDLSHRNDQLKVDVVTYVYGYKCGEGLVDNTLFVEFDIYNRNTMPIKQFHAGIWTDFALGCERDDYVGAIPQHNSVYAYNESGDDGQGLHCNNPTFSTSDIPIQSLTLLNTSMDYSAAFGRYVYITTHNPHNPNPTDIGPFSRPGTALQKHYVMTGRDILGRPMFPSSNHIFSGNPNDNNSWNMISGGMQSDDFEVVASSSFPNLSNGGKVTLKAAYITHYGVQHPKPDITAVANSISTLENFVATDALDWDLSTTQIDNNQNVSVTANILNGNSNSNYTFDWSNGQQGKNINVTESGVYTVVVTNVETGCKETVDVTVDIEPEDLTLPEEPAAINAMIYPNPAIDVLNINIQTVEEPIATIIMIDAFGQQVKLIPYNGSETQEINISDLNTGIYTLGFQNKKGQMIDMKKVVVTK